jgi:hypothetical protein
LKDIFKGAAANPPYGRKFNRPLLLSTQNRDVGLLGSVERAQGVLEAREILASLRLSTT